MQIFSEPKMHIIIVLKALTSVQTSHKYNDFTVKIIIDVTNSAKNDKWLYIMQTICKLVVYYDKIFDAMVISLKQHGYFSW